MFRGIQGWEESRRLQWVKEILHYHPTSYSEASDIFIIGYPKSGHTWMQHIMAALVFGVDPGVAPDSLIQELVVDVHYRQFYRRFLPSVIFKAHDLPDRRYRRVIYILRDGRDAMVSYFKQIQVLEGLATDFIQLVRNGVTPFGKWHEHVNAWRENPYAAEMMIIKYEELKTQPVVSLSRVCEFLSIERTAEDLARVIDQTTFRRMQKREIMHGWENGRWESKESHFTRRGEMHSYLDEMPGDALKEFMALSAETMAACGYL